MLQKTIKLNSGYDMPTLGLGTWKSEPNKVGEAVKYALTQAGYVAIDGAMIYRNEPEIGEVYKQVFQTVKREDVFITSKLWNSDHHPSVVEEACKKTLHDLNLEYLDLYLMHWGIAFKHGGELEPKDKDGKFMTENISIRETWEAMENLVKLGLVKSIGVANFTGMMLHDLLTSAHIRPAVDQIEVHPYNAQTELLEYCKEQGIVVTAYSPLGRQGAKDVTGPRLFDDQVIKDLSEKYGKPASQILLNWAISRGTIAIPKSVTPERIKENIGVYDFELSAEDVKKIDGLNKDLRFVDPSQWWRIPCFK